MRNLHAQLIGCLSLSVLVSACTSSTAVRTSSNTAIIKTSAAPACGSIGAARVAQKQAAVETLRAGFDRYIIVGAASASNITVTEEPGTFRTSGYAQGGYYSGYTTYTPGISSVSGSHNQSFAIAMFREGEPSSQNALPAREALGPKWQELVKSGNIGTCLN